MRTLILNGLIVNEQSETEADIYIVNDRIEEIGSNLLGRPADKVIDATNCFVLPGMIDDQVHFREPGLTHKADIAHESRAAVAGGITSYMEMPNVKPPTLDMAALKEKRALAHSKSYANYAFYMGASNENIDVIKTMDTSLACGVKVFMGASTGNLLVDNEAALEAIFRECPILIATHCEDSPMIAANQAAWLKKHNGEASIMAHPVIRNREACYASSSLAVGLAKRMGSRLHVLHLTTAEELALFSAGPVEGKRVTAEACVHHLWFSEKDYETLGNQIKCNPAIKCESDRLAILKAVRDDVIDVIATDHAPHTWEEKQQPYLEAPAGLPLVQHALLTLMSQFERKQLTMTQLVQKICHNPAILYQVKERGFVREGYYADLVVVDPSMTTKPAEQEIYSKCGWSPFSREEFSARITSTFVNGRQVFDGEKIIESNRQPNALEFNRD